MAEALEKVGIELTHIIGPRTKHAYHPSAKIEVERRLAESAKIGRQGFPKKLKFATYTLRYNRSNWLTIDALGEQWEDGSRCNTTFARTDATSHVRTWKTSKRSP